MGYEMIEVEEKELATSTIFQNKIIVPKTIREMLNLEDGDKLIWIFKQGEIIMRKIGFILKRKP